MEKSLPSPTPWCSSHWKESLWVTLDYVLYNIGGIFFILSFFVLYILPFGLVHELVRCTHWVQVFTCVRGGCDNHRCTIKTQDRKWDWGREWRHAWKRWAEDFGIWKKTVSWDLGLDEASRFSELTEARLVVCGGGRTWWGQMEKSV